MIDTHLHLNDDKAFPNLAQTIEEAAEAGVEKLVVIGIDLESSQRAVKLAEEFPSVWAVVGHHPNYSNTFKSSDIERYKDMARQPKTVAIGEIGLDYHWDFATHKHQAEVFSQFLNLANELDSPVVLHCREAYPDVLSMLEDLPRPAKYLFHCFAGDEADLERASALDAYFGVDGPLTYPKAVELRRLIATIPRDRILLETDSPYLTPVPFRGKPNSPAYLPHICTKLAEIWGVDSAAAGAITSANALRFFGPLGTI
jgi:TatD DNase family protein